MTHREFSIERQLRLAKGITEAPFIEPSGRTENGSADSSKLAEEVRALRADLASLSERFPARLPLGPTAPAPADDGAGLTGPVDSGSGEEMDAATVQSIREENEFLRREIARMVRCMAEAKEQIAAIKHPAVSDNQMDDASNELNAIVSTTEHATHVILEMGEGIQDLAERLNMLMGSDEDVQSTCSDIINKVNAMFEACNFQDITGQRVTKVVSTLEFIEERLRTIINVWGKEAFAEIPIPERRQLHQSDELVNGPALNSGLNQDEIDALFG